MITSTMNPVESFLNKAKQDSQLRKQLETLRTKEKNEAISEIVKIAAKAGFKFSAKEYEEIARNKCSQTLKANRQITDEELVAVACGTC